MARMSVDPVLPTVSVVIPTVGRPVLAEVVGACLAQDPLEVIVVADRDEAAVGRILADVADDPRIIVVAGSGRGSASARQAGVDRARGDVILLLDDDVVPGSGLVGGHARAHRSGPGEVVVGFMPVTPDARDGSATARIYDNDYRAEIADLEAGGTVLTQLWGGNVSMTRADAHAVPQSVASYPFDCREDQEFGLRAAESGLRGRFVRDLTAGHHYERSADRFLRLAADQTRVGPTLRLLHPGVDVARFRHPGGVVGVASRVATVPGLGRIATRAVAGLGRRLGDGPADRWRVGLLVVARAMAQADAARR